MPYTTPTAADSLATEGAKISDPTVDDFLARAKRASTFLQIDDASSPVAGSRRRSPTFGEGSFASTTGAPARRGGAPRPRAVFTAFLRRDLVEENPFWARDGDAFSGSNASPMEEGLHPGGDVASAAPLNGRGTRRTGFLQIGSGGVDMGKRMYDSAFLRNPSEDYFKADTEPEKGPADLPHGEEY